MPIAYVWNKYTISIGFVGFNPMGPPRPARRALIATGRQSGPILKRPGFQSHRL
jgi:hypothetical protein